MIISTGGKQKEFDKIQHPFMIKKKSQQIRLEGTYFNIIKATCYKPTANIILNAEKVTAFPLRTETR